MDDLAHKPPPAPSAAGLPAPVFPRIYHVAMGADVMALVADVNDMIARGLQPLGGICVEHGFFYQAMVQRPSEQLGALTADQLRAWRRCNGLDENTGEPR